MFRNCDVSKKDIIDFFRQYKKKSTCLKKLPKILLWVSFRAINMQVPVVKTTVYDIKFYRTCNRRQP